jgi:hypothetical protein
VLREGRLRELKAASVSRDCCGGGRSPWVHFDHDWILGL